MNEHEYESAFKIAHTLKGVIGNLSFADFYFNVSIFVDCLRNNTDINSAIEKSPSLKEEYENLVKNIQGAL